MNKPKCIALYARVPTIEKDQDPQTRLRQLREYTQARGWQITAEYVNHAPGTSEERSQYKAMRDAAKMRKIDVVLVWHYDQFARTTQALVNALQEFRGLGLDFTPVRKTLIPRLPPVILSFTADPISSHRQVCMAPLTQFKSSLTSERVRAA